ncbi:hypothetical protein [Amycolatopsis lexingtonensis]
MSDRRRYVGVCPHCKRDIWSDQPYRVVRYGDEIRAVHTTGDRGGMTRG